MTSKSLAVSAPDYASFISTRSILRIAIPSWRAVGIHQQTHTEIEGVMLSREELQNLFRGELNDKVRKRGSLTAREEQEKTLSKRLRRALYPYGGSRFSH
jgi:hypothetical protein